MPPTALETTVNSTSSMQDQWQAMNETVSQLMVTDPKAAFEKALASLDTARQAFTAPHPSLVEALEKVGTLCLRREEFSAAGRYFHEALEYANELLPSDVPALGRLSTQLGLVSEKLDRIDDAILYYEQAIPLLAQAYGRDHPQRLNLLNNVACLLKDRGRTAQAESFFKEAIAIHENRANSDTPALANVLNNYAALLTNAERLNDAECQHLRALAIRERCFGPNHPDVGQSLANLAVIHHLKLDVFTAADYYQRAVDVFSKHPGLRDEDYLVVIENYADLLRLQNEEEEADRVLARMRAELSPAKAKSK